MIRIFAGILIFVFFVLPGDGFSQVSVHINQVGFNSSDGKIAVISANPPIPRTGMPFVVVNSITHEIEFKGQLSSSAQMNEWFPGKYFYLADFSSLKKEGQYILQVDAFNSIHTSPVFFVGEEALAKATLPAILNYYHKQRANTPQELEADKHVILYGSNKTANVQGGWCDASGDISKYFSHLCYTNFMSPQQIPLVTWSMENAVESIPALLTSLKIKDSLEREALYGADYVLRSLSPEGYFYTTVFSYFKPDPNERRIVGLLANSVTTSDYQSAFREGGGMGIAALARAARWKKHGDSTSQQYLAGAKKAFAHLQVNNLKYCDDGKENILDDYCALMAATELWITTNEDIYKKEARKRAKNISNRLTPQGYFVADDGMRPFWHASDAGMPVVALSRYLAKETDASLRNGALQTIQKALDYNLHVTNEVSNPFGYARQTFAVQNKIKDGFFIPHENESGWWWQGENARLASLATAALVGGKLVYGKTKNAKNDSLQTYAARQLSWILGCNPYDMCFINGFGKNNVPHMASMFGHGSEWGGISNGVTGGENPDGSGILFKEKAEGNEWRWTEQWLPHAAWFLQAITAMGSDE
ncbi:glycoside hydrolase family 9 protein [Chitinophagaceae bacterium 26-R-25]|nr:glycoside hydrolase family 9 protein [Chitinophagaceae bacterium 26-R-25]